MDDIFIFKTAILSAALIFLLPVRFKAFLGIVVQVVIAFVSTTWAIDAWQAAQPLTIELGIPFWGGTPVLIIDKLSAFFILLINIVCVVGTIYGAGYLKPYQSSKSTVALSLHAWAFVLLHASMLHVVMLREGFAFLMAWEVMSMSSFLLVIFNAEEEENLTTGIKYLIQMHAGFTFLLLAFLWVAQVTGQFGFDGLAPYFATHTNWIIFLVLFAGFGIKAGFIPLHSWLPHAHPAAPSSVSGVMSGIMIKMGIYGILRVLIDIQSDFLTIGLIILGISLLTSIGGILYATLQRDIKKLLAYSSIENIGIIGVGIGIAILGNHFGNPTLTTLGLTGATLHILNHALYKSLLFFSAGNVYYSTHTRDMNKLGGLFNAMPLSGALFLIGALSISAIPPFNGFISEFLIYSSILQHIVSSDFLMSMVFLAVILTLVIVGGLSVYSFTKAFGITFLGSARSKITPKEVPLIMRIPGMVNVVGILLISLFSPWVVSRVAELSPLFTHLNAQPSLVNNSLPAFTNISLIAALLFGVITVVFLLRKILQRNPPSYGPTWGCGYSAGDARHQYTATSYAHYLRELAGPTVATTDNYVLIQETEIFPQPRNFKTETKDYIEEEMMIKPVHNILQRMEGIGWAQTGKIGHYLVYPLFFLLIIVLLTRFGIL